MLTARHKKAILEWSQRLERDYENKLIFSQEFKDWIHLYRHILEKQSDEVVQFLHNERYHKERTNGTSV